MKKWFLTIAGSAILMGILLLTCWIVSETDYALRSVPETIIFWVIVLCILCIIFSVIMMLRSWAKRKQKPVIRITAVLISVILTVISVLFTGICFLGSAFSSQPEHVVIKDDVKMVACVEAYTDVYVYYYEYKGLVLRGNKCLGEEWYGSGGYDPFTTQMEVSPKTSTFEE